MHADYADIRARISETPAWYDENGVPRYGPFTPKASPDIYARLVVLLEIECQQCGERFMVQMSGRNYPPAIAEKYGGNLDLGTIHYGDPPRHDDPAGNTMNVWDLRLVEVWMKDENFDWTRHPEMENNLEDADETRRPA